MTETANDCWCPNTEVLLALHGEIVDEYDGTEPGVRDDRQLGFALDYVERGHFGAVPESIHEKAFHLLRLLVVNHPFVDGNKRTALNATALVFAVNGHRFDYGDDLRAMVKLLAIRDELLDATATAEYLSERTAVETSRQFPTVPDHERLLDVARRDRDEHREIYDALADE